MTVSENEYILKIICPIVSNPLDVTIHRQQDEKGILLTVSLHKDDMGKIIGKQGETARAIRKIMHQYGATNGKHISVKINEPTI